MLELQKIHTYDIQLNKGFGQLNLVSLQSLSSGGILPRCKLNVGLMAAEHHFYCYYEA